MYAVVELLGNDYWKHKPKLDEIDKCQYALNDIRREITMVWRLGVINFHGFNYLATLYGKTFKLSKELIKLVNAINLGKHTVEFKKLYVGELTQDPKEIYPYMKKVFNWLLEDSLKLHAKSMEDFPSEHKDPCYIDWDTVNSNFKKA